MRCEVLHLSNGDYELRVVDPDGTESVERFSDPNELARRQQAVVDELKETGWTGPHGWVL